MNHIKVPNKKIGFMSEITIAYIAGVVDVSYIQIPPPSAPTQPKIVINTRKYSLAHDMSVYLDTKVKKNPNWSDVESYKVIKSGKVVLDWLNILYTYLSDDSKERIDEINEIVRRA